jgi:hypothetical protein
MDNINIITSNPVVDEYDLTAIDPSEYYYNNTGPAGSTMQNAQNMLTQATASDPTASTKGGKVVWDKVKRAWVKAKDSGLVDSALNLLNRNRQQNMPVDLPPPPPPVEQKGMSQGVKIALIVGGVAVVGVVLYLLLRNKPQAVSVAPSVAPPPSV